MALKVLLHKLSRPFFSNYNQIDYSLLNANTKSSSRLKKAIIRNMCIHISSVYMHLIKHNGIISKQNHFEWSLIS